MAVQDPSVVSKAAELLSVSAAQLQSSLTSRKVSSGRGSSYTVPLTDSQCLDTRDAMAKAIYQAVFDWVVSRLNVFMSVEAGVVDEEEELFVGLLDVFGFENFEFNSFEQLCINYTNEKLQQQFIDALVRLQQLDYEREGLELTNVIYPDNMEQLALLDSRMGVMGLLDEECALPKGSEEAYVQKMHKFFADSKYYEKPMRGGVREKRRSVMPNAMPDAVKSKDLDKLRFSITHYAGKVTYTADTWLDKNRGFLQPELAFLLSTSDSSLLSSLFSAQSQESQAKKKDSTVLSQFRGSLKNLSATLLQTSARYIRCIKPNPSKQAGLFSGQFISRQLRYTGVAAVVEIQRSGYPISLPKPDFISRYRCCTFSDPSLTSKDLEIDTIVTNILEAMQQTLGDAGADWLVSLQVQLGKTKVFMREDVVKNIEKAREAILETAVTAVQAAARRAAARKLYALLKAHKVSASKVRMALDDKQPPVATAAFASLQALWDGSGVGGVQPEQARVWQVMQRELGELNIELTAMESALKLELEQLEALEAAIASSTEKGGSAEFVTLKVALQVAKEHHDGLSVKLAGAISQAEGMLVAEEKRQAAAKAEAEAASKAADAEAAAKAKKQLDDIKKAEEEVRQHEAKRQQAKKEEEKAKVQKQQEAEGQNMRTLVVEVRNDPAPEKGTGIEINAQNVITALPRGGYGARDGRVRVGDIITAVDGTSVVGRKAVSAMDEKATSYKLTIQRYGDTADDAPLPSMAKPLGDLSKNNADMEGWLTKVKAVDGRATGWPEKRWVLLEGHTLYWYKDSKCVDEARTQSLENAVCTVPTRANGYQMVPAMQAFAKLHKYPFMLSWPNKSVPHELVFAASTSADRAAWANAMKDAINRAKTGAPTAGWLFKEGGRKSGLSMSGWKRRWFELPKGRIGPDSELKYYDSPNATQPKGAIRLLGSDVFIPKQVRGIKADYRHNFCVTSEAIEKGKATVICTLLAAGTVEDRNMWVQSLSDVIKPLAAASKMRAPSAKQVLPGNDSGASGLQAGASTNLEQMKMLDKDVLETLRIKQLKAILSYMKADFGDAVEKKDLINKIVELRG